MVTRIRQGRSLQKLVAAGRRYAFDLYCPLFPSPAADRFLEQEARRHAAGGVGNVLQTAIVAVTRECPLRCEHCCEWDTLNHADVLTGEHLRSIVDSLCRRGVTQIFFTGGEPLRRLDDLLHLCHGIGATVDCWIITSGVGLTPDAASRLAAARFTGVVVSVDHWDPERHDAFRGRRGAFEAAMRGAQHATDAGLALALSICPTREFVSRGNLERYAALARRTGASFIQIMEPRAVGHYAGRDVQLTAAELEVLEAFADSMNFDSENATAPIVSYPALFQRRYRCLGGDRYLYVDTNGEAHACPFCRSGVSVLDRTLDEAVCALQERGCPLGATTA
jgi:MoaA/NifB/PqqE/SkfB family radical SAM enzyme